MKRLLKKFFRAWGFDLVRYRPNNGADPICDLSDQEKKIIATAAPFTMTSTERMAALLNAVTYVTDNGIPGDIAECGVWRGGSMMIAALVLLARRDTSRSLFLYDTFEGMAPPTGEDRRFDGAPASQLLGETPQGTGIWCRAGLEDVRANLLSTGYPPEKIHFVKGKVEDTIPKTIPAHLSLLRLDTDWYESTRHELVHLFPRLDERGVLILDDYGHWQGARKAADEYFDQQRSKLYLHRIDYSGRILVKTTVR